MPGATPPVVDELLPDQAFRVMAEDDSSALVDVRTRAEWSFVGLPDLSGIGKSVWPVEWIGFPDMNPNARFDEQLAGHAAGDIPKRLFFICRSGARSMAAARHVAASGMAEHCTNVAEGFEGDLDNQGHRGSRNGWKARGLPWRQS